MNPSTEDMLNAIDRVNADTVFILPNNKNIILAANQAQMMVEDNGSPGNHGNHQLCPRNVGGRK